MGVSSVLIIDAMCVVNNVTKTLKMTNAMHFEKIGLFLINMCQIL